MPNYRVWGMMTVSVSIQVEADDEDDAFEVADEVFDGLKGYAGNGGTDKLVGVSGPGETIEPGGDYPEWDSAELLEDF